MGRLLAWKQRQNKKQAETAKCNWALDESNNHVAVSRFFFGHGCGFRVPLIRRDRVVTYNCMGPQSEGLGSNSGSATSLFVDPWSFGVFICERKCASQMCGGPVFVLALSSPCSDLEECWVGVGEG